eukprot:TRINITY_DN4308_c0_g1_i1.p1 TRINITY_DN4308_c0_g1~~TRINITY_DN4308_c0_g1_i1.p1  ORF type:complete len:493 (+),score=113.78 TRINITY_DN4308_c0_g1_i1:27-1505(+)
MLRLASNRVSVHSSHKSRLPVRSFSDEPPKDRIQSFAEMVDREVPKNASLSEILNGVWKNEVITSQCPDLVIRLTALRGEVSKRLWSLRGGDPEQINVLAVGTTAVPNHLTGYHHFLQNFFQRVSNHLQASTHDVMIHEIGYDLLSKGSDEARRSVLDLFNDHYDFPKHSLEKLYGNSAITSGGMRGLKDIADACIMHARETNTAHRFIQPDNSFGTWWNIIERPERSDTFRRTIHSVQAKPENRLHLTEAEINGFYKAYTPSLNESWYITPVGNPSGTASDGDQLKKTCDAILHHNPNSIIILDSVYARTMLPEDSRQLFKKIVSDDKLMDRIVWVESFSKSHGLCRERLGMYFSTNEKLFTKLHTANITYSAGPGVLKDYQFRSLGESTEEDKKGVASVHEFWRQERKGLYNFLMSRHSDLFDADQKHIQPHDMDRPCTLYVLLKTREKVKAQDVFVATGALGVDTPLLSGHHIRFSVGQLLRPTYSQYA